MIMIKTGEQHKMAGPLKCEISQNNGGITRMIYGAILAGGSGTRMKDASLPKQFLPLGKKPIIIHTLEKMTACSKFDAIYIGINPNWMSYMTELIEKFGFNSYEIKLTTGGESRDKTIFNVIDKIERDFGIIRDDDIIVTHDAVRPFVTLRMIEDNINAAIKYGACDTVVPAIDTIVKSRDGFGISEIPDRKTMYQGQTPQSFNIKILKELYEKLSDDERLSLTDACKICIMRGVPVKLVDGDISNMKITTVADYKIAQAIVQEEERK